MNSVLLIGDCRFTTGVVTQVRGLDSLTVTRVTNVTEAMSVMAKAAPDVLIVQSRQLIEGSISKTFSIEQPSTYFVVIEEAFSIRPELRLSHTSELHLERTAFALEAGADAYLWLVPNDVTSRPNPRQTKEPAVDQTFNQPIDQGPLKIRTQIEQSSATLPLVLNASQRRLIQAHIQIGLNQAQRYRDLSRINDWLSAVALVDALTQLNNRRSFDLELPRKIKMARTKEQPLSLMVMDIDHFKAVNDRHGHLVGDDVLKMLAKRLLANMRFYDTPFRYGGEEFVVTLSNTDLSEGIAIAQRLKQSISQRAFDISTNVSDASQQLPLTVSIGLTELNSDDDDQGRSFLHRADQYLLQAKAEGRNRVVSKASC
ncbi:MAG: GGDEF domain-containing protein [Cyanobacteria bacterium P01_D01_bin.105]